ncbi:hypothetical protein PORCAN_2088 [Porphyromonas crevioricanis JCM 13913]|nr:hypothetical protein PORCAN_2088 [Porphyromonas crevioricanis JCM 13913]
MLVYGALFSPLFSHFCCDLIFTEYINSERGDRCMSSCQTRKRCAEINFDTPSR